MGGNLNNQSGTSTKPGGANKQEAYDVKTGKYVAESGVTDQDIVDELNKGADGFFGQEGKDKYDSLDEDGKKDLVNQIQELIKGQKTEQKMTERFAPTNINDFMDWNRQCLAHWGYDPATMSRASANQILNNPNNLGAFYNGYKGAGDQCFEFLKAARMGYDEYILQFGQERADTWLGSRADYERRLKGFDEITSKFECPKDCQVYRLVDENYIAGQFKDILTQKGFDVIPELNYKTTDSKGNPSFKTDYETIDRSKYSVQEIAEALQDVIGYEVNSDNAPMSFGMDIKHSHMIYAHNNDDDYKRIWIKFDVPQGTKMFVSDYMAESEGVFHRGLNYFIKDVTVEKDPAVGRERVVLLYGIR